VTSDQWTSLLVSIFGAGGTGAVVAQFVSKQIETSKRKKAERAIRDSATIIDRLQDFQADVGAGRVLLLYASNGGGIPSAGKNIHVTIVHELKDKELDPIKSSFQHMVTDAGYVKMLSEVIECGIVMYEDPSSPESRMPHGFLQDLYAKEGVKFAYIRHVKTLHDRFYFVSARWYRDDHVPVLGELNLSSQILLSHIEPML